MTDVRIGIVVDSRGAKSNVDQLNSSLKGTESSALRVGRALQAALATVGVTAAIREVIRINDTYAQLEGRLRLVTKGTEELISTQDRLFKVAQSTGTAYEATVDLYARIARGAGDVVKSQEELFKITQATNQAFQISGASAQEAASGVMQFGQALQSGVLQGDELRSIRENAPRLFEAIIKGAQESSPWLKATKENFRELAGEGKITSDVIVRALLTQSETIGSEYGKLPNTVGKAMEQVRNEINRTVASADMAPLIESIDKFRKTITDPATIEGIVAIAQALTSLAGIVVKAAAEFATLGDRIGFIAAQLSGNLAKVEELRVEIEDFEKARGMSGLERFIFAPVRALGMSNEELDQAIASRRALLDQLAGNESNALKSLEGVQRNYAELVRQFNEAQGRGDQTAMTALAAAMKAAEGEMQRLARTAGVLKQTTDDVAKAQNDQANSTEIVSKETQKYRARLDDEIKERAIVLELTRKGIDLQDAETEAKLRASGATEEQIRAYIEQGKALRAVEKAAEVQKDLDESAKERQRIYEQNQQSIRETVAGLEAEAAALFENADANIARTRAILEAKQATSQQIEDVISLTKAVDALNQIKELGLDGRGLSFEAVVDLSDTFKALDDLNLMFEGIGDTGEQAIERITKAAKAFAVAGKKTGEEAYGAYIEGAANALGALQTFTRQGSSEYEALNTIIQVLQISQGILAVINAMSAGDGYTAIARGAAVAAAIGSMGVNTGFGGGGSSGGALDAPRGGGLSRGGTVLGDPEAASESIVNSIERLQDIADQGLDVNRQMLNALTNIEQALGAASAVFARTAGMGGVQSATFTGTAGNVSADFDTQRSIKFNEWFGAVFGDITDQVTAAPALAIQNAIQTVFDNMGVALSEAIGALGGDAMTALEAFRALDLGEIIIKEGEDIDQAIQDLFSTVGDAAFAVIAEQMGVNLAQFQQIGEGAAETLIRLAAEMDILKDVSAQLGLTLEGVRLSTLSELAATGSVTQSRELTPAELIAIADALAQAAGGVEQFAQNVAGFFDFALSDSEMLARQGEQLSTAFESVGLTLPDTREGVLELVQGLDLTTASGQAAFSIITALSPALEEFYGAMLDVEAAAYDVTTALGITDGFDSLRIILASLGFTLEQVQEAALGGSAGLRQLFATLTTEGLAALQPFIGDILSFIPESARDTGRAAAEAAREAQRAAEAAAREAQRLAEEAERLARAQAEFGLSIQDQIDRLNADDTDLFDLGIRFRDLRLQAEELGGGPLLDLVNQLYGLELQALETARAEEEARIAEEEAARQAEELAAAQRGLADEFKRIADAINSVRSSIAQSILDIRRSAPGFDESAFQTGRIRTLRGQIGAGSVDDQIGTIQSLQQAIMARYQAEQAQLQANQQAAQAAAQAQQQANDAYYEQVKRVRELKVALREFADSMLLDSTSPLTNQARFDEARSQFLATAQRARGGDVEALQNLQGAASAFQKENSAFFGSSASGIENFDLIQQTLRSISAVSAMPERPRPVTISAPVALSQQSMDSLSASTIAQLEELDAILQDLLTQQADELKQSDEALQAAFDSFNNEMVNLGVIQTDVLEETRTTNRLLRAQFEQAKAENQALRKELRESRAANERILRELIQRPATSTRAVA